MKVDIQVPAIGESITEAVIGEWLVNDGEYVEQDSPVCMIESEKDKGTTVRVYLEPAESKPTLKPSGNRAAQLPLSGFRRILIVEDDRESGMALSVMLEKRGFEVVLESSAEKAWARFPEERASRLEDDVQVRVPGLEVADCMYEVFHIVVPAGHQMTAAEIEPGET